MGNIQTLAPFFEPGQSGNPKGGKTGPRGHQVRTKLRELLQVERDLPNPVTGEIQKGTIAEFLAVNLIKQGSKDDKSAISAITAICDHTEGRLAQTVLSDPQPEPKAELAPITFEQAYLLKHGQEAWAKQFGKKPGDMLPALNADGTPKPIEMKPVQSNNVKSVGYDPGEKALHIHFRKGGNYVYKDVPESTYRELLGSQSIGKYLAGSIKDVFEYEETV